MKKIERIAADANVILSAIRGGAALRVFRREGVEVVTTEITIAEVRRYLPVMAESYDTDVAILEAHLRLLPIREYSRQAYHQLIPRALRLIGHRDPDDADLLALALSLDVPIWSNDRDFEGVGITYYTTAKLLRLLE